MTSPEFIAALGAGGITAGLWKVVEKLLEKYRPKHVVKGEVNADYQSQIEFLNGQVSKLEQDVGELRAELRNYSKREHRLHLIIHRHCRESPACSGWFDSELAGLDGG